MQLSICSAPTECGAGVGEVSAARHGVQDCSCDRLDNSQSACHAGSLQVPHEAQRSQPFLPRT